MSKILRISAGGMTNGALDFLPGSSGYGTLPVKHVRRGLYPGSNILGCVIDASNVLKQTPTSYAGSNQFEQWLRFQDFIDVANRVDIRFNDPETCITPKDTTLNVYSLRMHFMMQTLPTLSFGRANIISFLHADAGTPGVSAGYSAYSWNFQLSEFNGAETYRTLISSRTNATSASAVPPVSPGRAGDAGNLSGGIAESPPYTFTGPYAGSWPQAGVNAFGAGTASWRLEIQVDSTRAPYKVVARVYPVDGVATAPRLSLGANPERVDADRIYFGDDRNTGFQEMTYLGEIEMWDTYDADGQYPASLSGQSASISAVGTPYKRTAPSKYVLQNAPGGIQTLSTLTPAGSVSVSGSVRSISVSPSGTDMATDLQNGTMVPPSYTRHTYWLEPPMQSAETNYVSGDNSLVYSYGDPYRLALHYPAGTPPTGGWPLICWTFSGFFVSGTYRKIPQAFVYRMLNQGFAVASIQYVTSTLQATGTYPAYNTAKPSGEAGGGKFPTYMVNFKQGVKWLQQNGSVLTGGLGTYPLNANKVIYMGYSAGGYVATAAALSADMTSNGTGVYPLGQDMTLAGNTAILGGQTQHATGGDPRPLGALSIAGPVDMGDVLNNDWTYGGVQSYSAAGFASRLGLIGEAGRAFLGRSVDQSIAPEELSSVSIPALLNRQIALGGHVPALGYVQGGSDFLIKKQWAKDKMDSAAATAATSIPYYDSIENWGVTHDRAMDMLDYNFVADWLSNIPGL
jgi:acetyl esterase/lipase